MHPNTGIEADTEGLPRIPGTSRLSKSLKLVFRICLASDEFKEFPLSQLRKGTWNDAMSHLIYVKCQVALSTNNLLAFSPEHGTKKKRAVARRVAQRPRSAKQAAAKQQETS